MQDHTPAVEPLKLKEVNEFFLRNVDDVAYWKEHAGTPGFLYSLTTQWLKEGEDGTRFYQIKVKTYRMLQHGRKTTFGGAA